MLRVSLMEWISEPKRVRSTEKKITVNNSAIQRVCDNHDGSQNCLWTSNTSEQLNYVSPVIDTKINTGIPLEFSYTHLHRHTHSHTHTHTPTHTPIRVDDVIRGPTLLRSTSGDGLILRSEPHFRDPAAILVWWRHKVNKKYVGTQDLVRTQITWKIR